MAEKDKLKPPKITELPLRIPGVEGFTTVEKEVQNLFIPDEPEAEIEGFSKIDPENARVLEAQGIEFEEEPRTVKDKIAERFFGTDVDDPEALLRGGSIMSGALTGANIGSKVPPIGPLGPLTTGLSMLIGSGVGVAFGAIAPEMATEIAESLGALPEGTRNRSLLSPTDLRTLVEGEILLDAATGGGLLIARQTGRTVSNVFTGVNKESRALAQKAADLDIHLMPVQVGERTIPKAFVTILGRFPFLGGRLKEFGQASDDAAKKFFSGLSERVGPVRAFSDISEDIFENARSLFKEFKADIGARYDDFFLRADKFGVKVVPKATLAKAEEILERLSKQTRTLVDKKGSLDEVLQKVKTFLEDEVLAMERKFTMTFEPQPTGLIDSRGLLGSTTKPPVLPKISKQTLRQMDGLVTDIDLLIASFEPAQRKYAMKILRELRQAVQYDSLEHLVGRNADLIKGELQALDLEFSQTMSEIFETATANRFSSVRRKGITGTLNDETTRTPIDQLAKLVVKLESPQSIDELFKLVKPQTFKDIVAKVMDDAVEDAFKNVGEARHFDVDKFAKRLGLNKPKGKVFKSVEKMLQKANAPYTMADLQDIIEITRKIEGLDIPDISTFIARRATLGGLAALKTAFLPGLAVVGVGSTLGEGYGSSTVIGLMFFMGGSRLFSKIITDPKMARSLKAVIRNEPESIFKEIGGRPFGGRLPSSETGLFARRKLMIQTISLGMKKMLDDGDVSFPEWKIWTDHFTDIVKTLDREFDGIFDNSAILDKHEVLSRDEIFDTDDDGNLVSKRFNNKEESSLKDALEPDEGFGGDVTLK